MAQRKPHNAAKLIQDGLSDIQSTLSVNDSAVRDGILQAMIIEVAVGQMHYSFGDFQDSLEGTH